MSDLRWSVPLSNWSFRDLADAAPVSRLDFIEPMTWRRLSALSRAALQVAHDCCAGLQSPVRMVFASRHGELERTTAILRAICAGEPVSPNAFSLSVLNAVTGIFGIARRDQSPATAISAGVETLGYALLDAGMQHRQQPDWPVLLVYAHERADPLYGVVADDAPPSALALLIDAQRARGYLECTLRYEPGRQPGHQPAHEPAHEWRREPAFDNLWLAQAAHESGHEWKRELDARRAGQTLDGTTHTGASMGVSAGANAGENAGIAVAVAMGELNATCANAGANVGIAVAVAMGGLNATCVNAGANVGIAAGLAGIAGINAGANITANTGSSIANASTANANTNANTNTNTSANTSTSANINPGASVTGANTASANTASPDTTNANPDTNAEPAPPRTQSDALHRCLATRASSAWQGPRHTWRWRWLELAQQELRQPEPAPGLAT